MPRTAITTTLAGTVACLALLAASGAWAQAANTPVGKWAIQWSFDNTAGMGPVGGEQICFAPNGTWYSPTFAGWAGRWFQKGAAAAGNGDTVSIAGNYAGNVGNDGAHLDFVTANLMTGPWVEWRDGYGTLLWVRVAFTRAGPCPAMMKMLSPSALKAATETKANPITPPPNK